LKKVGPPFEIDSDQCIACGACEFICPTGAVKTERARIEKMRLSDTGTKRYCRYMRLGLVDFMLCSNGFECWRCEVDQRMEDRFGTHPAFALKPAIHKRPFEVAGFAFHPDCFYSEEHLWAKRVDQLIRMGLDGLLSSFALAADSIHLPPAGSLLKKKEALVEIVAGKKKVTIAVPLSGTLLTVNRDAIESPNLAWRDPYDRGWLILLKPDAPEDLRNLYSGEEARRWFAGSASRFAELLGRSEEPKLLRGIVADRWDRLAGSLWMKGRGRDVE
jgi:glycine cleavage system H protein